MPIEIPPLRERPDDIEPLVGHFTANFCAENNYRKKSFSARAIQALCQAAWRGNVRELRNAVERLLIMSPADVIEAEDLPQGLGMALGGDTAQPPSGSLALPYEGLTLQQFKDGAERTFLIKKLRDNDWNVAATAKAIDTPRSNLYKKLDSHRIDRESDNRT